MVITNREPNVTKFCLGIYSKSVHQYDYYSITSFVASGVLIMMITLAILSWKSKSNPKSDCTSARSHSIERNIRAARLLSLISLNIFVMWVVPDAVIAVIDSTYGIDSGWFDSVAPFMWNLQPFHAVTNFFIYFRNGSPLRQAMKIKTERIQKIAKK